MEAGLKDKKEESEKRTFVRSPVSATRVCVYFVFFLAGLFHFRRDFFIWRVFYAGTWVRTLCIPYYRVMNIISNIII